MSEDWVPLGGEEREEGIHYNGLRSRRTHDSNFTFRLPGGTEDNDLWVKIEEKGIPGHQRFISTWVPTQRQRQEIADGANLDLILWGANHPPVAVAISHVPIGKLPDPPIG